MSTDLEIVVDVDLDATIPCEAKSCDEEATWRGVRSCCALVILCCDVHMRATRDYDREVDARVALAGGVARCGACGVSDPPDLVWTKL